MSQPTPEEVRASFAVVENYDERRPDDPVAASERALLGTVIQSADAAREASAILTAEHFASPAHQLVYEAVMRLTDDGQPVEPASVLADLAHTGTLTKVGAPTLGVGGAFLHSLIERAGSVGYHAAVILAAHQQREVQLAIISCRQIAEQDSFDPDVHLDEIRKRIEDVTSYAGPGLLRANSETVPEVLDSLDSGTEPGLRTGIADLDEATGGVRPGEMLVLGARPGIGKTLVALCMADYVGTELRLPVLFSSLEMTEEELTQRRIAALAEVPLHNIVRHCVTEAEWKKIHDANPRLLDTRLHIDDTPHASLAHIRSRLRAMDRTGNAARLLVIDYLGFMAAPKAESRQQAVAELARQCKNIARDFDVPVILLSQLNRGVEGRHDKKPQLADLRESGEIEQSADIVILLHREDAYTTESPRAGEMDLLVLKNRQGPQCTVTVAFQGHYGRVADMSAARYRDGSGWTPSSAIGDQE